MDYFASAGSRPVTLVNQNCTIPLVGPSTYEKWLLLYERSLAEYAREIGADAYAPDAGTAVEVAQEALRS